MLPPKSIEDDRSPHVIKFIEERYELHLNEYGREKPFFIGLNGIQGAGKTTLVTSIEKTFQERGLETLVSSIDDFYLNHDDQLSLATAHPQNPLVQHRGEPGTHDMHLAKKVFTALKEGKEIQIPQYDKSRFNGQGDRVSEDLWPRVNGGDQRKIQIIIFEGWCVGYRSLTEKELEEKHSDRSTRTLHKLELEHLKFINSELQKYDLITDTFDAFVHIDAEDPVYAYDWRKEQEEHLRRKSDGIGMTDEQVEHFVDNYFPGYELYLDGLRNGVLKKTSSSGTVESVRSGPRQLRIIVGKDRKVIQGGVMYVGD